MKEETKGRLILMVVYLFAFGLGFWVSTVSTYPILLKSAVAVGVAVTIIFLGSIGFNNSSMFDPYWSIAPSLMILYYLVLVVAEQSVVGRQNHEGVTTIVNDGIYFDFPGIRNRLEGSPRIIILFLLTLAYSARLTWNFLSGWHGLKHEDWRYVNFRKNSGKAHWVVSFFGIHLFPALMVFGGTLSIWVVSVMEFRKINLLDIVAIVVTSGAILLEAFADRQLRKFVRQNSKTGITMSKGLWAFSRHPNYLGEILFWWGLYLFALAANPLFWWVIIGPVAITLMFLFASIPMIEKRLIERRKDYREYMKEVPMLIPGKKRHA
jgi:steroid 5-alpha reductase family enzyme